MNHTPIRVLIPTCGRCELLDKTLASLAAHEMPPGYVETVVIENGTQYESKDIVEPYTDKLNLRYICVAEGNKSAALNAAMESIDDGVVIFLDDDVRFDCPLVSHYAQAIAEHDGGCYYGGPISAEFETDPEPWVLDYLPNSSKGWELPEDDGTGDVTWEYIGSNWAAWAQDIKKTNGFDPLRGPGARTGSTGQETQMQRHLRAVGCNRKHVPDARVWHFVPTHVATPQWILKRVVRHGIAEGIDAFEYRTRPFPLVWIVLLLRWCKSVFHLATTRFASYPPRRFSGRYWYRRACGRVLGGWRAMNKKAYLPQQ